MKNEKDENIAVDNSGIVMRIDLIVDTYIGDQNFASGFEDRSEEVLDIIRRKLAVAYPHATIEVAGASQQESCFLDLAIDSEEDGTSYYEVEEEEEDYINRLVGYAWEEWMQGLSVAQRPVTEESARKVAAFWASILREGVANPAGTNDVIGQMSAMVRMLMSSPTVHQIDAFENNLVGIIVGEDTEKAYGCTVDYDYHSCALLSAAADAAGFKIDYLLPFKTWTTIHTDETGKQVVRARRGYDGQIAEL